MPVIIHRVIYGTLERFLGVSLSTYREDSQHGLRQLQVRVMSISEQANGYAEAVHKKLKEAGIRTGLDISDRTLDYKIREGQLHQVPYMLILGKKEADSKNVSVRSRTGKQKMGIDIGEFISMINDEVTRRDSKQVL